MFHFSHKTFLHEPDQKNKAAYFRRDYCFDDPASLSEAPPAEEPAAVSYLAFVRQAAHAAPDARNGVLPRQRTREVLQVFDPHAARRTDPHVRHLVDTSPLPRWSPWTAKGKSCFLTSTLYGELVSYLLT